MNAVLGVCNGSLATRQRAKKEVEKMKITKTINKATIVSVNQSMSKYAVKIEEFVKFAHVEQ